MDEDGDEGDQGEDHPQALALMEFAVVEAVGEVVEGADATDAEDRRLKLPVATYATGVGLADLPSLIWRALNRASRRRWVWASAPSAAMAWVSFMVQ